MCALLFPLLPAGVVYYIVSVKPLDITMDEFECNHNSSSSSSATLMLTTFTLSTGRSVLSVRTRPSRCTILIPLLTLPKTVCFPSRCGVGARVMKNWLPLVSGPAFAILTMPAPVCLRLGLISSANGRPQQDSPPRPVPVGSPVWIIKLGMTRWMGMSV